MSFMMTANQHKPLFMFIDGVYTYIYRTKGCNYRDKFFCILFSLPLTFLSKLLITLKVLENQLRFGKVFVYTKTSITLKLDCHMLQRIFVLFDVVIQTNQL